MKFMISLFPAVVLLMIITSCGTSVNVTSDYDHTANLAAYKTFSLYDVKSREGQVSQLNADRITNAIRSEMKAKGFTEVDANPDLMVNAVTILKNKQAVTANTNYYGYGGMYRPYGYWGATGGMVSGTTTYSTYNYKDGSLIVDIVDAKTQKLIWEGIGNSEIDAAPKNPDQFISDAVKKIMADFPPGVAKK